MTSQCVGLQGHLLTRHCAVLHVTWSSAYRVLRGAAQRLVNCLPVNVKAITRLGHLLTKYWVTFKYPYRLANK